MLRGLVVPPPGRSGVRPTSDIAAAGPAGPAASVLARNFQSTEPIGAVGFLER